MATVREFLDSKAGKAASIGLVLVGLVVIVITFKSVFSPDAEVRAANQRMFVDSTTGKSFGADLKAGMAIPIDAPSGSKTGFPAEACWWTKDGKVRTDPYYVMLNTWKKLPEPTYCPDCGRLVVQFNPVPQGTNPTPPPTKEEYKAPSTEDSR